MSTLFEFRGEKNPRIVSPKDSEEFIRFNVTKKDLEDFEVYEPFVNAVKSLVRKDPRYTNYKNVLMSKYGMNRCQVFGEITSDMAEIEMHHGLIFNLFEVCGIVTDHLAEESKRLNSMSVADEVLNAHERHEVGIVMLCETGHEAIENGDAFLPYKSMFGQVDKFIKRYKNGLRKEHLDMIKQYLTLSQRYDAVDNGIFELIERVGKYIKK